MQLAQFEVNDRLERTHWWFTARRKILRDLIAEVLPPGSGVVDIGCGTGANLASLLEHYRCTGYEPSKDALRLARERHPAARFVGGPDVLCVLSEAGTTDLFLLADVLEHVQEDRCLLADLVRESRPGTFFLLTVPADPALWSPHDVSHGHFRRYTSRTFQDLWQGLPVSSLLVSPFNARLHPLVWLQRQVNRLRGRASGLADTDVSLPWAPLNRLLFRIFAGESRVLLELLRGARRRGYRRGVSLVALLRRTQ